ncbi:PD-(D/E)XK nuclease family protein [Psychrobacter pygoscelis]|uniref:PD-(D/E)XK nuclease family protein n=1 Tax=Psychrobacter pygoscelis TaxID=2488563 RepID=UPI00103BD0D7|nr:PD-(D/E)XK nuclease family protein [Psychrobacter pygoscelis]
MANLTEFTKDNATLNALYEGIKAKHNEQPRRYLGGSIIGKSCARQLWMDFRWVHFEDFDGRLLRLFETGHLEEPRIVQNMRDAGIEVYDVDDRTGEQFGVIFHGGHFRGHADGVALGILEAPKTWHLCEFKTHNDKSFKKLINEGVEKSKPMHYAQMQVYMLGLDLTRAVYIAKNKNDDELYVERVKLDRAAAESLVERAARIIFANEPPMKVSEKPDWFECKFCPYSDYCHGGTETIPSPLPNVNCRTCIHSTPQPDGTWLCEHSNEALSYDKQMRGCGDHRWVPQLLPNLKFVEAIETDIGALIVKYRLLNTDIYYFNNGNGSLVTREEYEEVGYV